jgi:hypothetical protein
MRPKNVLFSHVVVPSPQRLATSCLGAPDVDDGTWRPAGSKDCALAELLGTASAHEQSQQLLCLAAETKRLLQTQPTVVRVGAPAKVFGDIHGIVSARWCAKS